MKMSSPEFKNEKKEFHLPEEIKNISKKLLEAGFAAYLVGGCVRDLLLGKKPKDWDIATSATPEEIQEIFPEPESVYENKFGTVMVKTESEDESLKIIEVTTFRHEEKYLDRRHPQQVKFVKTIEEDLERRDFTINAIAVNLKSLESNKFTTKNIVDPFEGIKDLERKIIRAVGDAKKRFEEDALRLIRAARFAVQLNFEIEAETKEAIQKNAYLLEEIAKERIRDEFLKILETPEAASGIFLLEELNLLQYILPELRLGIGVTQNKHHIYTVFEHNVRALDYAAKKNYPLTVKLAALLHDIGKPYTKRGEGPDATFYNHEVVGAKIAAVALNRLRFPKEFIEKVTHLIRYHLFYYNVGEVGEAGVRRFLARVGPENVYDLLKVREADRIGSGVPKAFPYRLRHLLYMIEKVKNDPITPKMLKVDGNDVMKILKIPPGPKVGKILAILLEKVIENPKINSFEELSEEVKKLGSLPEEELEKLFVEAKRKKEEFEAEVESEMKKRYRVS